MTIAAATEPRAELLEIVNRSHQLGFCRWRVATALGASQHELALLNTQTAVESGLEEHRNESHDKGCR